MMAWTSYSCSSSEPLPESLIISLNFYSVPLLVKIEKCSDTVTLKKFSLVSMYDSSVGWANDSLKILDDDWMAHRMVSLRKDVSDEEVYALIEEKKFKNDDLLTINNDWWCFSGIHSPEKINKLNSGVRKERNHCTKCFNLSLICWSLSIMVT